MHYQEFGGVNSFLTGISKVLLKDSVVRNTRGYKCYELRNPIIIKINNPLSRIITIPERNWNYILPYVESLWLASGRNDMSMVGHYVKKLYDFSDDNESMRAGYGPRLRFFNGIADDYKTGYRQPAEKPKNKTTIEVDQFQFVEKAFQHDPYTRQAIVSLADPAKDCFDENHELKITKDFPCTRNIQFIQNDGKLDVMIHMRSNDFYWGASGVNIFNFTYMQEYFSQILGLEVGNYYHIVNNFHYYENFKEKLELLADIENPSDDSYTYSKKFTNLKEFDQKISALETFEKGLREKRISEIPDFGDDFFNDWAKVFYSFHFNENEVQFSNPLLTQVSKRKINKTTIKENRSQYDKTFATSKDTTDDYLKKYI